MGGYDLELTVSFVLAVHLCDSIFLETYLFSLQEVDLYVCLCSWIYALPSSTSAGTAEQAVAQRPREQLGSGAIQRRGDLHPRLHSRLLRHYQGLRQEDI